MPDPGFLRRKHQDPPGTLYGNSNADPASLSGTDDYHAYAQSHVSPGRRTGLEKEYEVLFTGESLGQVASQTLENLVSIEKVISIPVLRPLIGFDKEEIVHISKKINTYPLSILPFEDCCTLFVPKHPVTRPKAEELEKAEEKLPLDELLASCLDNIETKTVYP